MRNPMQIWKLAQPLLRMPTPNYFNVEVFNPWRQARDKVVFIMGATGTGKSRLSIDIAIRFPAEIINSDKIQVYKGLDIVTNRVTNEEQGGFPHHLLGIANPYVDFTAEDFCFMATQAVESILHNRKLPIIVGGSNSYIESLVSDPKYGFRRKYDCCFLWVDVSMPVLHSFVSGRVDKMVEAGLVDEVRTIFDPDNSDYSRGILRAIGVPELDPYFRAERVLNKAGRAQELKRAINETKENTCKLACRQLEKIKRLKQLKGWDLQRVDVTEVVRKRAKDRADEAWEKNATRPANKIVNRFLNHSFGPSFSAAELVTRSLDNMIRSNNQALVATSV